MLNKIGMHIHALTSECYKAMKLLQPCLGTVMDPTAQWIQDIREASRGTFIVGRRYEDRPDFWWRINPAEYARLCYEMVAPHLPDGWISANEPFGHDDRHLFADFDTWQALFVVALRGFGIEAVVNCFGTGNFTGYEDRVKITEAFPETCKVARWHGPHDYDWPNMDRTLYGRSLRWVKWLEDLEAAGIPEARIAVTECGLTQATYGDPDVGWQTLHDNLMIAADQYLDNLRWYNSQLVQIPQCIGCATYDWAGTPFGWRTFEHLIPYVIEGIYSIGAGLPPEEPEPPPPEPEPPTEEPGGEEMLEDVKVWKWDPMAGKLVELVTLEEKKALVYGKYGAGFRRADVAPGQEVYRLVELWEKTGHSALITQVLNEDGSPMANVDVAFYWPGAPEPPDPPTERYPHDWHRNFVHGTTNTDGEIGPGMGRGAYHGEGEGGPHAVWVRDPHIPSDICEKLGMLAGTFHNHLDQKMQLTVEGEEPSPSPGPSGGEGMFRKQSATWEAGPHNYIRVVSTNHELMDMRGNLQVLDSAGNVVWEIDDLIHPGVFDGQPGIQADTAYPEEEDRIYALSIIDLHSNDVVGGPWPCRFQARLTGTWLLTVEWSTQPSPEPPPVEPPTPPPGGGAAGEILDRLDRILADVAWIKERLAYVDALAEEVAEAL